MMLRVSLPPVVVLIPVLDRPNRVDPVLRSLEATTDAPFRCLFLASQGYGAEHERVNDRGGELVVVPFVQGPGDYARKINFGIRISTEPNIFMAADDVEFRDGWYTAACAALAGLPDQCGVVGTQDLGNDRVIAEQHSTHSLVTRSYVDQFGTIDESGKALHEGYPHEFVDDEFIETAKFRGRFVFAGDSVVEHLHPHWGKARTDSTYKRAPSRLIEGRKLYKQRAPLWGADPSLR